MEFCSELDDIAIDFHKFFILPYLVCSFCDTFIGFMLRFGKRIYIGASNKC